MAKIRRAAQALVLWSVVVAFLATIFTAHLWWPVVAHHAASAMPGDTLPGAGRKPTPAELEAARKNWMRRRFGGEVHGPSVKEVLDWHDRNGVGPPSPPDVMEPEQ